MTPPELNGIDWLSRFMEAQGGVAATAVFTAFKLGQLGVAGRYDTPLAREMLRDLKTDREDIKIAVEVLDRVLADVIANIERNLRAKDKAP